MNKKEKQNFTMRPYEKFLQFGVENLTDSELLAIIIRCGNREEDAESLAARILDMASSGRQGLLGLHKISMEQLLKCKGIGKVKAIQIKCVMEFCNRVSRTKACATLNFDRPDTVASYFMESLRHRDRECVILLCLDSKGHLLKEVELSKGTVKASLLSPREVFVEAVKAEAVYIMLLHNHPSGDPSPSREDFEVTENIAKLGKLSDIPLLDHIIIGDNSYVSFKESGYL
ncbi:MAG: DNA repair protein RadC [Lachnospiraceae bacterium]